MITSGRISSLKKRAAAAAMTTAALAAAVPVATAGAAPVASQLPAVNLSPVLVFDPPMVGSICSVIGEIVIGGQVMSPTLKVCTKNVTLAPITLAAGSVI